MSPADEQVYRYLRPIAERGLTTWYGDRYASLDDYLRRAVVDDVCTIMIEEGLLPSTGFHCTTPVMILDLRIYPADLRSYAECIS